MTKCFFIVQHQTSELWMKSGDSRVDRRRGVVMLAGGQLKPAFKMLSAGGPDL